MAKYKVVAPYVTVRTATDQGPRVVGLYQGAILPDDVPEESIQHHLDNDMIVEVDEPARVEDEQPRLPNADDGGEPDGGEPDSGEGSKPEPPAKNASKADWVDYAVTQGMKRSEAEQASRDELAARFAGSG